MFDGELVRVTLLCKNEMAGVIIDRFGKDTPMIRIDQDHFEANIDMALSPIFLGWVAGMGDGIRITGPLEAVDQMKDMIRGLDSVYGVSTFD